MGATNRIFSFMKASSALLGTVLGILFIFDDEDTDDKAQGDGSNLFGEHNFRTGQADSGTDPDGWYEEDM